MKKYLSSQVVTINTDASYDPIKKVGGWGCWIKSDFFTIKEGGKFRLPINDSNEAEIKALINGFDLLKKQQVEFKVVVINCDNKTVRDIVNMWKIPERFTVEGNILLKLVMSYPVCYAKEIKSHTKKDTARHWVNNWCDTVARNFTKDKHEERRG